MFDGLLLFRPLSPILSESVMTEPATMTYIRAGSCVRTCSSIRIYVWPDAYIRVDLCHRMCSPMRRQKDLDVFKKDGDVS